MMPADRRSREHVDHDVISGAKWTALSRWGSLLVSWPATILLGRLLLPTDYGYLALVAVFTGVAALIAEGGVVTTIVLGPALSEEQYRRLHGWSLTFFGAVWGVLVIAAAPIESLYDIAGLRWVVIALGSGLLLEGLRVVPEARMRRDFRFRDLAVLASGRVVVQAVASLLCAALGLGYWALVIGHLAGLGAAAGMALWMLRIFPLRPRLTGLRETLASSAHVLTGGVTQMIGERSDAWIGGAVLGATPLGGYVYMKGIAGAPLEKVSGILLYVAAAAFGTVEGEPERMRSLVLRSLRVMALMMFPLFTGLAITSQSLISAVLGEQWLPYAGTLQISCAYGMIVPIVTLLRSAVMAVGGAPEMARTGGISLLVLPPAFFLLGSRFGPDGLAAALLLPLPWIAERYIAVLVGRIGLTRRQVGACLLRPLATVAVMATMVVLTAQIEPVREARPLVRLLVQCTVGAIGYGGLSWLIQKDDLLWLIGRLRPNLTAQ